MNVSDMISKIPEDKVLKSPKIKENMSQTKSAIINDLNERLDQQRKNTLSSKNNDPFLG